jgi:P-type E1-E2 ATPase
MRVEIPGRATFELAHLVLDVNGTLAHDGHLIDGVKGRLRKVKEAGLDLHWITADTRGRQRALDQELGAPAVLIGNAPGGEAEAKAAYVAELGEEGVIAIGNGSNDAAMLKAAALGIAVLGPEGLAVDALFSADAVAPSILAALDMVADPVRLVATLRK